MRILVVTQYFWPENFRINDLSEELVKRGHQVTILTGKPNYPSGNLFPEYKENPSQFNEYLGCRVVRVPVTLRGQASSIKLVTNYASFVLSASFLGYLKLRKDNFDVIFVYEPSPVTVCLPAIFFKKIRGIPVVFWVQDLWPETLESVGIIKSPRLLSWIGSLVSFIYNRCDMVLGQSKAFYDGIERYCDDKTKIKYFPNWAEAVFTQPAMPTLLDGNGENIFKVVFAGNVGDAQDFPAILQAVELLKSRNTPAKFFIVGDGRAYEWLQDQVLNRDLTDYVVLLGRHPLESMPGFYAAADALLVTLKNSSVFSMTIPSKVQTYMAAGKSILSMLSGEGSRVIDEAKCGLTADSGDHEKLANNIEHMVSMPHSALTVMGEHAKNYAKSEFDRDKLVTQLESWFEEVVTKTSKSI